MKKILLTLALGAFIGGTSVTFAQDDTKKKTTTTTKKSCSKKKCCSKKKACAPKSEVKTDATKKVQKAEETK